MNLREYLVDAYTTRTKIKSHNKDDIRENIRTEYDYLCRRLVLLFDRTPDFAHTPTIDINETPQVVEYDEEGLFKKGELQALLEKGKEHNPQLDRIVEHKEDFIRVVSIFWYVVFLYSKDPKENEKQIAKAKKIIDKTANRNFSNLNERKKSYLNFFDKAGIELNQIFDFLHGLNDWNVIPKISGIIPENVQDLIANDAYFFDLFKLTEKAVGVFIKHLNNECDRYHEAIIDGYQEVSGEHLACEISTNEEDLFELLGYFIEENDQVLFDAIQLHNDWTAMDKDDRQDIYDKIYAMLKDDGAITLNRYVRAKTFDELKERLGDIETKLKHPILYRFIKRLGVFYDLLPKGEISNETLGEVETNMTCALKVIDAYNKDKTPNVPDAHSMSDRLRQQYEKICWLVEECEIEEELLCECEEYLKCAVKKLEKYDKAKVKEFYQSHVDFESQLEMALNQN